MLNAPQCTECKKKDLVVRLGSDNKTGKAGYYCGRCKKTFAIPSMVLTRKKT
jgi:transposase-like protein